MFQIKLFTCKGTYITDWVGRSRVLQQAQYHNQKKIKIWSVTCHGHLNKTQILNLVPTRPPAQNERCVRMWEWLSDILRTISRFQILDTTTMIANLNLIFHDAFVFCPIPCLFVCLRMRMSSQQYANVYVKSIFICPRSIAGVPFDDSVKRFWTSLLLRTTCMNLCHNWVANFAVNNKPKTKKPDHQWAHR